MYPSNQKKTGNVKPTIEERITKMAKETAEEVAKVVEGPIRKIREKEADNKKSGIGEEVEEIFAEAAARTRTNEKK